MVVPVVGMGRSGTSMAGRILNAMGVPFGSNLMPIQEDNPSGFWENRWIVRLHQLLLIELDNGLHSTYPLPPDWLDRPAVQPIRAGLMRQVRQELGDTPVWGFKDPRTARVLPLWRQIFDELKVHDAYVIVFRHPKPVAESFAKRDGIDSGHAYLLWLEYNLDAVAYTAGRSRVFVDYDRLLEAPEAEAERIVATIGLESFSSPKDRRMGVLSAVEPRLRHHQRERDDDQPQSPLMELVSETYQLLSEAAAAGDAVGLDDVTRRVFDLRQAATTRRGAV
jgi:hypothetical protein